MNNVWMQCQEQQSACTTQPLVEKDPADQANEHVSLPQHTRSHIFAGCSQTRYKQRRTAEHPKSSVIPRSTLSACPSKGESAFIALPPDLVPLSLPWDFWSQSTSLPTGVQITVSVNFPLGAVTRPPHPIHTHPHTHPLLGDIFESAFELKNNMCGSSVWVTPL